MQILSRAEFATKFAETEAALHSDVWRNYSSSFSVPPHVGVRTSLAGRLAGIAITRGGGTLIVEATGVFLSCENNYLVHMPWGLKRYQHARCLHYITFSCYHRAALLDTGAKRRVVEVMLERVRRWYGFYVTGYVVMPEHVHLLVSEPERAQLSVAIQMLKQITGHKLRTSAGHAFWQARYYGFNVWSEGKRIEKLRYIHRNPVKRGLVALTMVSGILRETWGKPGDGNLGTDGTFSVTRNLKLGLPLTVSSRKSLPAILNALARPSRPICGPRLLVWNC